MRGRTIIVRLLLTLLLVTMAGADDSENEDESEKHQPETGDGQYPATRPPSTSNESMQYVEFHIYAALGPG
jgi:hypothetical protein